MKLFTNPWLLKSSILFSFFYPHLAQAQVVPDNTLPENTIVTSDGDVIQIDGGTRAGNNLFHSFEQFSVETGNTASFNNAVDIKNILSRVTGTSISEIDGIIGAKGAANLFLINPNGIMFGENAVLNIGGSFIGSTADSIVFPDGFEFSATDTQASPILIINAPIGLGFRDSPGSIVNRSLTNSEELPQLEVKPGKTLALVGGDVTVEGGYLGAGNFSFEGGRIELGSVAENNFVSLTETSEGSIRLGYEDVTNFKDIDLSGAGIFAYGDIGGDIQIQGRQVRISEETQVFSVGLAERAGNVKITASELVEIGGDSVLGNEIEGEATGENGSLTINTEQLIIKEGAQVSARVLSSGKGVDLTVNATQSVEINDTSSGLFARVDPEATGNGGNITINTAKLTVRDGGNISTNTEGAGNAGNIIVNATESVELIGTTENTNDPSSISAQVMNVVEATGDGGDVTINTQKLILRDGAQISTLARNEGNGGNLTVNASESVFVSGTLPILMSVT